MSPLPDRSARLLVAVGAWGTGTGSVLSGWLATLRPRPVARLRSHVRQTVCTSALAPLLDGPMGGDEHLAGASLLM